MVDSTIINSPLGRIAITATEIGITSMKFVDDEQPENNSEKLTHLAEPILSYLNGESILVLPLDINGTAFQKKVWAELVKIPYGATVSYNEIANRINQPTATRAVARACAANNIALAIPCHRVLGKNGNITGYRWGVDRKLKLIELERQITGGA